MSKYKIFIFFSLQIFFLKVFSQQGEWTWMNGDNFLNSPGVYGTQGTPNASNTPPGLYEACEWTDLQGNFWLFGGAGANGSSRYGDLWKYDPVTNEWAWMKGPGIPNQSGVYGTQGVSSAANNPGGRCANITWTDNNGNLWLFGGLGYDVTGAHGVLSDLWKYDIATNEWTWMKGDDIINQYSGVYGTITVSDPANHPGARNEVSCSWTVNDELWLFGGDGWGFHNDLWKYNTLTNEWTWMKGSNTTNQAGVYGTQGVSNAANTPGSRWVYSRWKDSDNNLWLFGGYGYDINGGVGLQSNLNDLWKYNISTNEWTWMSGSSTKNNPGNYGTKCTSSVNYLPSCRCESRACWTDNCGKLWLFGGIEMMGANSYNDLWVYDPATNEWTWVSGSNISNQTSIYGTKGVSNPANMPGSRSGSVSWIDTNENLWLFGGHYSDKLNDLWRYVVDPACAASSGLQLILNNDTNICEGSDAIITAVGAADYIWNNGSTVASITVSPQSTITYTVTGTNGSCSGTDEIIVIVNPIPTTNAGNDTVICIGAAATITANGASDYEWNTTNTNASITVSPQNTTTYTVTGTDNNCSDTDEIVVTVSPLPTVNAGNDTVICLDSTITLTASGFVSSYLWSTGETNSSITITPQNTTTYIVTAYNTWCSSADDKVVTVNGCALSTIFFPNVFTPNGDGENDIFKLKSLNIIDFEMYIFNRWGQEIFYTTDINEGWDGKYKGKLCPQGVYTWLVFYKGIDNTEKQKKYGYVTLLK